MRSIFFYHMLLYVLNIEVLSFFYHKNELPFPISQLRSFGLFLCSKKDTANTSNQHFISVKLLHCINFVIPTFPQDLRGQQLEIKPPHFIIFHLLHYLALVKSKAILSKFLNVIGQSSLGHPTDFLPFALASKSCLGSVF